MLKRCVIIFAMVLVSVLVAPASDFVLVIDAGHGGKDPGCVGRKTNEKTIVLDIARRLGKKIEASGCGIKVVYTRKDDRFISLQKRADIANAAHGNLFLSLHVNSVKENTPGRDKVRGIAVYTLGPDKSSRSLEVAMRENSVMELEPDYSMRYKGFDPKSAESYIVFEMTSNLYMRQSIDFATLAQKRLIGSTGRYNKGVHQSGFWVLWSPNMPSVLAELEFICNPSSEDYLCSEEGKQAIVDGLYKAVTEYSANYIRQNKNADSATSRGNRTDGKNSSVSTTTQKQKAGTGNRNRRSSRSDKKARR